MSYAAYSLTGCQYLAKVVLFYTTFGAAHLPWDSPLDYLCVFGCATYSSLLETPRDGKLTPSGVMDMHLGYDLGPPLEEGICIQLGRVLWVHFFLLADATQIIDFHHMHAGVCLL